MNLSGYESNVITIPSFRCPNTTAPCSPKPRFANEDLSCVVLLTKKNAFREPSQRPKPCKYWPKLTFPSVPQHPLGRLANRRNPADIGLGRLGRLNTRPTRLPAGENRHSPDNHSTDCPGSPAHRGRTTSDCTPWSRNANFAWLAYFAGSPFVLFVPFCGNQPALRLPLSRARHDSQATSRFKPIQSDSR